MAIEVYLLVMAVVLLGGMFVGLLHSYRESEEKKAHAELAATLTPPSTFFGSRSYDTGLTAEMALRQIELQVRQELLFAERFIDDPRPETLRAGYRETLREGYRSGVELQ